jgi:TolB protein
VVRLLPALAVAAVCASVASAAAAPSGHVVFLSGGRIWMAGASGSALHAVSPASVSITAAALSHDGRRIAYVRRADVYVMNVDGTHVRRLTYSRALDGAPAWSGDDRWIAWSAYQGSHAFIFKMRASDGGGKKVLAGPGSLDVPAWSPDSRRIAYAGVKGQVWVMNADGTGKRALTHTKPGAGVDWAPSWSPNGQRIAYESNVSTGSRNPTNEIWLIDANGTHPVRLTHNFVNDQHPAWSPDGAWLAFSSPSPRPGLSHVWLMRPNGSGLHRLTPWPGEQIQPSWGR